ELEQKAGVDLLVRRRGGIRLTNAGSDLVARAEEILERFDALEDALRMHARARSQQIRILTNTSAVDVLTEFLAATLAQFPKLRVQLEEVPSREASRRLAEGEVDLAIVSLPPREEGLEVRPLWLDPLVAVNARDDEAPVDAQTFATIVRGPMIGLPVASPATIHRAAGTRHRDRAGLPSASPDRRRGARPRIDRGGGGDRATGCGAR
ncbi:Uncharacterized HTH-type transcriptional regulator YcgK, partial [Eumeta japonica]